MGKDEKIRPRRRAARRNGGARSEGFAACNLFVSVRDAVALCIECNQLRNIAKNMKSVF